jgi:hypothetical protein
MVLRKIVWGRSIGVSMIGASNFKGKCLYENSVLPLPVISLLLSVLALVCLQQSAESMNADEYQRTLDRTLSSTGGGETLGTLSLRMSTAEAYRTEKRYGDAERMYSIIISACRNRLASPVLPFKLTAIQENALLV